MYFQIVLNLIFMFSYICNSCAHFHMYKFIYLSLLPLAMTLFVCQLVASCEVGEGIACLSVCVSSLVHLLVWIFTFTKKSDCDKINLLLSAINIITILVKLSKMIRGYFTGLVVYQFCLSLYMQFTTWWC